MQIKIIERQKQIELEEKEILRRENQYDSEVKKKADADRYSVEQAAAANKAKQIAEAEANKYRIEAMAKAEAERVRLDGLIQSGSPKGTRYGGSRNYSLERFSRSGSEGKNS